MKHLFRLAWLVCLAPALSAAPNHCADCHFASGLGRGGAHLADWERSPHGRADVGCEKCHGGDPTTFDAYRAHRDVLNARNPASPVHPANLPRTCGGCHPPALAAFQKSRHYEMLREASDGGPTCSTCHGEVAAILASPKTLEGRCRSCHGVGKRAPRADYPPEARRVLEQVQDVRDLLRQAMPLIRRTKDVERREDLQAIYRAAEAPLADAVAAGHAFVFAQSEERLASARERAEALLELLANPPPPARPRP
jgi:hypothetical protein